MNIEVKVSAKQVLDQIDLQEVVDHLKHHGDIDLLLKEIGIAAIIRYLDKNEPIDMIMDELAEHKDILAWAEEQQSTWVSDCGES